MSYLSEKDQALIERVFARPFRGIEVRWQGTYLWEQLPALLQAARSDGQGEPLAMILHCPACGVQHLDEPDEASGWTNPPHRSHLCQACGYIWRPADIPTTGVATIATHGDADSPTPPGPTGALAEIGAERIRQMEVEGWTPDHDDRHADGALARAAAVYASDEPIADDMGNLTSIGQLCPWSLSWFKPQGRRRSLIKAGALIVAEIERQDRASAPNPQGADHG